MSGRVIVAAAWLDDHIADLPNTLIVSLDRELKVENLTMNEKKAGTLHFPLMCLYECVFALKRKCLKGLLPARLALCLAFDVKVCAMVSARGLQQQSDGVV